MKKITFILLSFFIFSTLSITAQELEEILQSHYEVMGYEKLLKINTMVMSGKSVNQGMENEFTMTMQRPAMYRLEVPIQGQKMVQVYNNGEAWYIAPWTGSLDPQDIAGDQIKRMKKQADFEGPLYDYESKGNKVELVGTDEMEGSEVYKIKLTDEFEDETIYLIDAENYVILKEETTTSIRGQEMTSETYYSSYKPYGDGDMIMAYNFEVQMNGQVVSRIIVEDVQLDAEIDKKIFERPPPADPVKTEPADK